MTLAIQVPSMMMISTTSSREEEPTIRRMTCTILSSLPSPSSSRELDALVVPFTSSTRTNSDLEDEDGNNLSTNPAELLQRMRAFAIHYSQRRELFRQLRASEEVRRFVVDDEKTEDDGVEMVFRAGAGNAWVFFFFFPFLSGVSGGERERERERKTKKFFFLSPSL
ncbi:hypothetical protein T439DRAFT_326930 [Meredithblackwellia eburnea MCA 4105]